jgi:hypothetical protein
MDRIGAILKDWKKRGRHFPVEKGQQSQIEQTLF